MHTDDAGSLDFPEEYTKTATILLRGYLRLYVLELLQERPHAGSEIAGDLMRSCEWRPSPGTVYPLLRRLEKEGLAESCWDTAARPRRVYTITPQGESERVKLREKLEPLMRRTLRMLQIHVDYLFGRDPQ